MNGTTLKFVAVLACAGLGSACGEMSRQGRSPGQVIVNSLEAAAGGADEFSGFLQSDVITRVDEDDPTSCTVFNDSGRVTMSLMLKDPGTPTAPSEASSLNQVTFNRVRVEYRRTDGRNQPGVDVPYPFESAATFTVPESGQANAAFNLVRQTAKLEAPLMALRRGAVLLSMIADVTFYGRDQAGNDVATAGSIGITFGDFGGGC